MAKPVDPLEEERKRLAQAAAAFAKANPMASPGVVLAGAKAGVDPKSATADQMTTLDVMSKVAENPLVSAFTAAPIDAVAGKAAKLGAAAYRASGSPADFLAPITRTAFMLLTTPYQYVEALNRWNANKKNKGLFANPKDLVLQTDTGQAVAALMRGESVDVGTGFLDVDPTSKVGRAVLMAKYKASPKMKGDQVWTYSTALTQKLFDDPDTKAARTFQGVAGFITNLAFDPLTYVPGIGFAKTARAVGATTKAGKVAEAAQPVISTVEREAPTVADLRKARRDWETQIADLDGDLKRLQDDFDQEIAFQNDQYEKLFAAKNSADQFEIEYGPLRKEFDDAQAEYDRLASNAKALAEQEFPAWDNGPRLFHGTSMRITDDTLQPYVSDPFGNLYGQGFYTTENADVAASYMRKDDFAPEQGNQAVYSVRYIGGGEPRFIDLDQVATDDFYDALRESFDKRSYDSIVNATSDADVTAGDLYKQFQSEMIFGSMPESEAIKMFRSLSENLYRRGYSGFQHLGGGRVGDTRHNVKIWFDDVIANGDLVINNLEEYSKMANADLRLKDAKRASIDMEIASASIKGRLARIEENIQIGKESIDRITKDRIAAKAQREAARGKEMEVADFLSGITRIDPTGVQLLDFQKFSDLLLGRTGRNVATMIAKHYKPGDELQLWRAFNREIKPDLAKALAAADNEKDVLGLLAREAGLDLGFSTKTGLAARAVRFDPGDLIPAGRKQYATLMGDFFNTPAAERVAKFGADVTKPFRNTLPTTKLISLENGFEMAKEMDMNLRFLGGKAFTQDRVDFWVTKMLNANVASERFEVFTGALEDIVKVNAPFLNEAQLRVLRDKVRIFRDEFDRERNFLATLGENTSQEIDVLGNKLVVNQTDPFFDSQLTMAVRWPDTKDIRRITTFMRNVYTKNPAAMNAEWFADAVDSIFNRRFKQVVLVGRGGYILRTVGDMQVRSYLTGSMSIFTHPAQMLGMMIGNPEGGALARFASKFSRFDNTVLGDNFNSLLDADDSARFASDMYDQANAYASLMGTRASRIAGVVNDGKLPTGVRQVFPDERSFNRAWASTLLMLRKSKMINLLAGGYKAGRKTKGGKFEYTFPEGPDFIDAKLAQGFDENVDAVRLAADFMVETKQGRELAELVAKAGKNEERAVLLADDIDVRREAWTFYLAEAQKAIDLNAAGIPAIKDFLAGKSMVDISGNRVRYDVTQFKAQDKWLASILKEYRSVNDVDGAIGQLKLYVPDAKVTKGLMPALDNFSNNFFQIAAIAEKRASLGPEFRQQYWNAVSDMMPYLSKEDAVKVLAMGEKEMRGLKVFGVSASVPNPALVQMRNIVKNIDDKPGISLDDLDDAAMGMAAKRVEKLFYDAARQGQWAAAFRLSNPFIAAWANTLKQWGVLIGKDVGNTFLLRGKARAYKAANIYDYLDNPESSGLYDLVNENWYDPSQGFIYDDPTWGDKRIVIPLVGRGSEFLLQMVAPDSVDVPNMPVTFSVPSANLAFQQEILPGVGPALTLPLEPILRNQQGFIADMVRKYFYPFGMTEEKSLVVRAAETFTPAWLQRIVYGMTGTDFENKSISTLRPMMAWLRSTGNYSTETGYSSPEQNGKLLEDAMKLNRVFSFWRGVTQNLSPGSIKSEFLALDKDGELHVQALMYNDFVNIRANNPDDYGVAISKWADRYGWDALMVLVSGTRGGVTPTSDAWKFYQNNRETANKYPDAFALFFPGGEYSQEFAKWQEQRGTRERLTGPEMANEATGLVYTARKGRLQEIESMLVAQGADAKTAHAWYLQQKDALDSEFGGDPSQTGAGTSRDQMEKQIREAMFKPEFAETEAGQGLREFLVYLDAAKLRANQLGYKTLSGKNVANLAEFVNQKAAETIEKYPAFSVMYWRVFASETGNK